ncbi:MAG: CapA family protein [Deltaproteobacteria bacterium]|nr:CapA family protein [Deltaproteobacteria bacterium]
MIAWAVGLALALAPTGHELTLVFGGDVALGRVVAGQVRTIGGGAPLGGVAAVLGAADLVIVNLECALSDAPPAPDGVRLIAPTSAARVIAQAGVDVVSLANNHALDAGPDGLLATERALADAGVDAVGAARRELVREVGGLKVGIVAATDHVNAAGWRDRGRVAWLPTRALIDALPERLRRVRAAREADVWIVLLHWGEELAASPSEGQRALARALVDAGATLVVGHGAHVVQEAETRGAGAIVYNLGNLVFDMEAPATRVGALARVRVGREGVRGLELIPTRAGPDEAPTLAVTPR